MNKEVKIIFTEKIPLRVAFWPKESKNNLGQRPKPSVGARSYPALKLKVGHTMLWKTISICQTILFPDLI